MHSTYCFAFEAKSIQSTILDGGKLRDMVGGSVLIDSLCSYDRLDLVEQVKAASGLANDNDFTVSRRAGAALIAFHPDKDALARFSRLWSLTVAQLMPGLAFVSAIEGGGNAKDAMEAATKRLTAERNRSRPSMPTAGPLVRRYQRTGRAATEYNRTEGAYVDAGTAARRRQGQGSQDRVARKFYNGQEAHHWPIDFEDDARPLERFPLPEDNRYVGLMHADGNGLGQLILSMKKKIGSSERAPRLFRAFSDAVAQATEKAAKEATTKWILPYRNKHGVMPARPIVLGGDDLTIILRADIALPFTQVFLDSFERETESAFDNLRQQEPELTPTLDDWPKLQAGAGIDFIKASQPFYLGYQLTESLAKLAKDEGKRRGVASLAFHRITTAAIDDYSAIRAHELLIAKRGKPLELSMQPYAVTDAETDLPLYSDLVALKDLIDKGAFASGPLRRAIATLPGDPDEGRRLYERWREVCLSDDSAKEDVRKFERVLQKLTKAEAGQLFGEVAQDGEPGLWRTPVLDALNWLAVERGGEAEAEMPYAA